MLCRTGKRSKLKPTVPDCERKGFGTVRANPEGFDDSCGTVLVTVGKKQLRPGTRNSLGINEIFADAALS
jgi:hypothetical protein